MLSIPVFCHRMTDGVSCNRQASNANSNHQLPVSCATPAQRAIVIASDQTRVFAAGDAARQHAFAGHLVARIILVVRHAAQVRFSISGLCIPH